MAHSAVAVAVAAARRRCVALAESGFAGNGQHHRGDRGGHHFARGPAYGGFGVYGFGVPFAFDYGWGYSDYPPDEPECYLRRVRVHHHWVWRQYCD